MTLYCSPCLGQFSSLRVVLPEMNNLVSSVPLEFAEFWQIEALNCRRKQFSVLAILYPKCGLKERVGEFWPKLIGSSYVFR